MHKDMNNNMQIEREREFLRVDCNKYFWHSPHQRSQNVRTILNIGCHSTVVIYDIREWRNPD